MRPHCGKIDYPQVHLRMLYVIFHFTASLVKKIVEIPAKVLYNMAVKDISRGIVCLTN